MRVMLIAHGTHSSKHSRYRRWAPSAIVWLLATCTCLPQSLAVTDAVIYESPSAPAVSRATVLMKDGRIVAFGSRVKIPPGYEVIRCAGCVVVAGFWNGHVHFTEPKWAGADRQPANRLNGQLQSMLTRSGFTTVVDTASLLSNTLALRHRIDSGELLGPRILTAGSPLYPPDGIPYYVKDELPAEVVRQMTSPADASEAVALVDANLRGRADIIKVFTGSWISKEEVLPMPEAIAQSVVRVAHRAGRLVFSHPSNLAGMQVAIDSGVDVLAHAPENTRGIDDALLRRAVARKMVMIPTLKLFAGNSNIEDIRRVVRRFHELGGRVVFGTDTGYLTDYSINEEFEQLSKAGFTWREILGMLTEYPSRLFGDHNSRGRIAAGMTADLTVLGSDPATDPSAFSKVRYTIRSGQVVYQSSR